MRTWFLRRARIGVAILLCPSLIMFGCTTRTLPTPAGDALSKDAALQVCRSFEKHWSDFNSYRGLAFANLTTGERTEKLRYAFIVQEPNSFRIELFPLEAFYSLGLLVTHGNEGILVDPTKETARKFVPGEYSSSEILGGLRLRTRDLLALLVGRPPKGICNDEVEAFYLPTEHQVTLVDSSGSQWIVDDADGLVRRAVINDRFDGSNLLVVEIPRYSAKPTTLPIEIRADVKEGSLSMELTFTRAEVNPKLKEGTFALEVPEGFEVEG